MEATGGEAGDGAPVGDGRPGGGARPAGGERGTPGTGARAGCDRFPPPAAVSRGSAAAAVPLRRRVAAEVGAAIRAGRYRPGRRLPGVRSLARRLGVHRNTAAAAYRELARRGMVEVRPGSGTYVADPRDGLPDAAGPGRDHALRRFLARERASGRSCGELAALVGRWREGVAAGRLRVVAPDPALAELWAAELEEALAPLDVRVEGTCVDRLREEDSRGTMDPCVVATCAGLLEEVAEALPPWTEAIPLRSGPGPRIRRLLAGLPAGSVVAVASRSRRVRREVAELAAAARGGQVAVRGVEGSGTAARRLLRVARFVLADMVCRPELDGRVAPRRLRPLRHLSSASVGELSGWLAGARRPAPAAVREQPRGTTPGEADVKVQVVRARVPDDSRDRYLEAWAEWSGTLMPMGIDASLLESEEERGRFVEITWFEEGDEAAVGDDRLARANAELSAAAEAREGDLHFYREAETRPV